MKYVYLILLASLILSCSNIDPIMPDFNYYVNNTTYYQVVVVAETQFNNYSNKKVEQYIDTTTISAKSKSELSLLKSGHSPEDTFKEITFYSISMDTIKNVTHINNNDWICSDSIYVDGGWGYSWTYNLQ